MMASLLNAVIYISTSPDPVSTDFRVRGGKKRSGGRDRGGCSLKLMFVVGLTGVFGRGLTQACAGSVQYV